MDNIIVTTPDQLRQMLREVMDEALAAITATRPQPATEKQYVYGIDGIANLFGVSKPTAYIYKKTFLAPAVRQRGRKILTDVGMARELYINRNKD